MRVGAERAERRLSEERVGWLCSAAYRLGIGRSQGQSSARIWTAAGTSASIVLAVCPDLNGLAMAVWVVERCSQAIPALTVCH